MTSSVVANTCRLTVMTQRVRVDLAVPSGLPVSELIAIIVGRLGPEFADEGAAQGGLVIQRTGEAPLDPGVTLAAAGIRDGELLHLRRRSDQLPEVAFDDVLDAVGEGVLHRTPRWQPASTRTALLVSAGVVLGAATIALLLAGPGWLPSLLAAAVLAVVLLLVATQLARGDRLPGAAVVAASFAIVHAFVAGLVATGKHRELADFGALQLLPAAAAAVFVAVVAVLLIGTAVPGFIAVIGAGALTAVGAAVARWTDLDAAGTAGLVAGIALVVAPVLPMTSFRLARLPLPLVPTSAADLRADIGRIDSAVILGRTLRADQYLTGLSAAVAVVLGGAGVVLSTAHGSAPWLTVVIALVCLLRARVFGRRAQRWPLIGAGLATGLALVLVETSRQTSPGAVVGFAGGAAAVAVVLLLAAAVVPGRRSSPPVARSADVLEALLVLAVIPLALAVMGVYGTIENLVG
ncbi:MAG: type VII secretion integral membrane protein EccD [Jatrophihabitans sp.]|uniref:type VII secretion integral membrane protein EccD n=1 Tax=Jatrophihabitans sp. TaxID=1932789 RepID=UPI003F7CE3BC